MYRSNMKILKHVSVQCGDNYNVSPFFIGEKYFVNFNFSLNINFNNIVIIIIIGNYNKFHCYNYS